MAVNITNSRTGNGGEDTQMDVTAKLSWNGTLHVEASNVEGKKEIDVVVIVNPHTTTTTTTTTSTTTTSTTPKPSTTPRMTTVVPKPTSPKPTHAPVTNSTSSEQTSDKNLIFIAAFVATCGVLSAGVVGFILFKYMGYLDKLNPSNYVSKDEQYGSRRKHHSHKTNKNKIEPSRMQDDGSIGSPRVFVSWPDGPV